jgi:hypothetical protein
VFAGPSGQIVLADLMRASGIGASSFAGDPHRTAFNEGQRNVAIYLIRMINSDPDAAARMLRSGDTEDVFSERNAD